MDIFPSLVTKLLLITEVTKFCLPLDFTLVFRSARFFDPEDGGDMFFRNVG
jgi:hypothetical protein